MNRIIVDCNKYLKNEDEENKAILKFVNENQFYTLNEWNELLNHYDEKIKEHPYLNKIKELQIENTYNHIKLMYENCLNENYLFECGKQFNDIGGFDLMTLYYYIFQSLTPFNQSKNIAIRGYPNMLNHYWNNIGYWVH